MSIQITITDPTRDEALRLADYLFALAGYGKKDGIVGHERVGEAVSHKFETTPAQVGTQLKSHIESMARTPVEEFIDAAGRSVGVVSGDGSGTALPPLPPAAPVNIDLDSAGHVWDERIHASSKAVVSDGTWRLRRNLDPKVLEAVLAERASHGSAELDADAVKLNATAGVGAAGATLNDVGLPPPAPGAWPFPSDASVPPPPPITHTGVMVNGVFQPVVTNEPLSEPAVTVSVGAPPPPPPAAGTLTFAAFMQRVTAAIGAGTIAQTDVAAALGEYGVASIPLLASVHADKIDAVAARLGV